MKPVVQKSTDIIRMWLNHESMILNIYEKQPNPAKLASMLTWRGGNHASRNENKTTAVTQCLMVRSSQMNGQIWGKVKSWNEDQMRKK